MTRTILAMMAGLLCSLAGFRYAASLKKDAIRFKRWVKLLQRLALLLKEGTLSIPQALCTAADENSAPDMLLQQLASSLTSSPLLTLADAYERSNPSGGEIPILSRLFSRMGHGSKESRCLAIEQAADELAHLAQAAEEKADQDVKLYQTLGITGGICLTVLLL